MQRASEFFCEELVSATRRKLAFLLIDDCIFDVQPDLRIKSIGQLVQAKAHYLRRCSGYDELVEQIPYAFTNLVFHKDALSHIKKIGGFRESVDEIVRHLFALNQYAKEIFINSQSESDALNILGSKYGIICSGKGLDDRTSYKKTIEYNGKKYELTCNPHTKLFNDYSDARIYFCWGRDEIKDHSVIIACVGDHWN